MWDIEDCVKNVEYGKLWFKNVGYGKLCVNDVGHGSYQGVDDWVSKNGTPMYNGRLGVKHVGFFLHWGSQNVEGDDPYVTSPMK